MKSEVIESSFWDYSSLVSSKLISLPVQLIILSFATRILGTDGYGRLALFFLVCQIVLQFGINWTSASVIRYGREEYIKEHRINKVFWGRHVILVPCLMIFVAGIITYQDSILKYIGLPQMVIWFLLLYIIGATLLNYVQFIQQAIGQLKLYALSTISEKLISAIGLITILIFVPSQDPFFAVVGVLSLSCFCVALIFGGFIKRENFYPIVFDKEVIRKMFFFSYPLILGSASAYVVNWIDVIVIEKYLNISDVGLYTLSYQGMQVLQGISMSLITLLGPIMVTFLTDNREDLIVRFVKRIIPQGVFFWCVFLSLIICIAPFLIPRIFGEGFSGSVSPFLLLMIGLGFNSLACYYSPILTAYELIKRLMLVNILLAVINLGGDFLLVPVLGINGAAIATSLSFGIAAILYMAISNRHLNLSEWRHIFSIMPIPLCLLVSFFFDRLWQRSLGFIIIVICAVGLAKISTMFKKEDLEMFSRINMPECVRGVIVKTYSYLSI
jgi:O-antigen/teichoic acid export membrane protein